MNLKFDELARRIAKLETAPAPAQDDTLANEVAGLRDQLAAATANMQKLESKLEAALAAPKPDAAASAAPQPAPIDTARIAAQLGALSGTVDQGKPYQAELSALQDTAKLTLNLPALTANATTGIATTAQLKQDLAGLQATLAAGSDPNYCCTDIVGLVVNCYRQAVFRHKSAQDDRCRGLGRTRCRRECCH